MRLDDVEYEKDMTLDKLTVKKVQQKKKPVRGGGAVLLPGPLGDPQVAPNRPGLSFTTIMRAKYGQNDDC